MCIPIPPYCLLLPFMGKPRPQALHPIFAMPAAHARACSVLLWPFGPFRNTATTFNLNTQPADKPG